jgi:hypothetical protein
MVDLPVHNKVIASNPITIQNPNGSIMTSTHLAELPIPDLPLTARMAHILPALQSHLLVSIGTMCDAGCDITFSTTTVTVCHNDVLAMSGTCTPMGL